MQNAGRGPVSNWSPCDTANHSSLRWVTATGFGCPAVPEV